MGHPGWGAASSADGWSFHPWLGPQTLSYLRYRIPRAGNNSCQFFLCYGNTVDEIAEFVIVFHVDAARLNRVGRRYLLSHGSSVALDNIGQKLNIQVAIVEYSHRRSQWRQPRELNDARSGTLNVRLAIPKRETRAVPEMGEDTQDATNRAASPTPRRQAKWCLTGPAPNGVYTPKLVGN
jgi:hypothetical protein